MAEIFSDDDNSTDLADFQYLVFNLITAAYFVSQFLNPNGDGLPIIPDTLLGLASVSAALYVGKKAVTRTQPSVTGVFPAPLRDGQPFSIIGTGLTVDPSSPTSAAAQVTIDGVLATAVSASGANLTAVAPANVAPGGTPVIRQLRVLSPYGASPLTFPFSVSSRLHAERSDMIGATPPPARRAGSLPFPQQPAGTVNAAMPFDHLIVVMMENHSFDNLLGALSATRSDVDGLSFDASGVAVNANPGTSHTPPEVRAFPVPDTAQAKNVGQSWNATHAQIAGGAMNGFVRSSGTQEPMGYYTSRVLPFAYSLAEGFTLANRWFCSVPGPTYPNRRFMMAGTAYGATVTGPGTLLDPPPPNGTIFDVLSDHNLNWCDYFTDVPMTAVIPSIVLKHSDHHASIDKFFHDCQAGSLPAVSFVDPGIGAVSSIATTLSALPAPVKGVLDVLGANFSGATPGETEEDPQNMYWGEAWAHRVVSAVLQSPKWARTLLIYTYDEHGGYYDHVAPPSAIAPDDIAPRLSPGDPPGGYDSYGPRVPGIVVSPYSRPGGVTDVIHDHTSILATIEHKWNLPALTVRDANATTVMDFLDPGRAALLTPPTLAVPPKPPGL